MTAPPTETDPPPKPVGLFAAIYKRAPLCNAEFSIPLEQVLEEEFDQLHPPAASSATTSQPESAPAMNTLGFEADQILDAARILSRLEAAKARVAPETTGELAAAKALRAVVRLLGAEGMTAIKAASPSLESAIAREFDGRLLLSDLPSDTCFKDFPLTDELRVALDQYAATRKEFLKVRLNRILLQAIFPVELRRIRDVRLERVLERIRPARHAALCLSGGGIRSATFALGFVQALASGDRLLHRFHYISTVSGGGYLGGWLSAWIRHAGREQVRSDLSCAPQSKIDPEAAPIRHLRAYSNFLSPKVGLLTADMWTLIATYVRNLIVNWIVLVPLLAALVMIPHLAASVVRVSAADVPFGPWILPGALLVIGFVGGVLAVRYVHKNRPEHDPAKDRGKGLLTQRGQTAFLVWCLAPLLISAMALTTAWKWIDRWQLIDGDANVALAFMGFGVVMHVAGYVTTRRGGQSVRELIAIVGTGAIAGSLAYVVATILPRAGPYEQKLYAVVAAPAFLTAILLGGNLFLGLTSRKTKDPEREWSARYSAWVLIAVVSWLIVSGIVLFGADLVKQYTKAQVGAWSIGGLASIVVAKLGFSPKTAVKPKSTREASGLTSKLVAMTGGKILPIVATIALVAILVLLSIGDEKLLGLTCRLAPATCVSGTPAEPLPSAVMLTGLLLLTLGLVAGRLIDTNKFSLHAMYRARLIRAYLGASRPLGERSPDPFTGFDEQDNVFMHELRPSDAKPNEARPNDRPIHVVNIALNLVSGGNLAWQERKAAPFSVSCLHAGSHRLGYRRTSHPPDWDAETREERDAKRRNKRPIVGFYGGDNGISLGTAMTISGAAASPNMGYHSSPLVTFLMTLLNVRLGWWLGNPGPAGDQTFDRASPRLSVKPILAEMFGRTNGANPYVYLSDGGHFENLALYEMVLRRCRFIVLCDASCDEKCELTDLGNAIRKIRIDLGIPIEFEQPFGIRARSVPAVAGVDDQYYAIATIRYSEVDTPARGGGPPSDYDGTLLYVKPAFYGKEPKDVFNYATESAAFPHESTADQFFSETQFESYRALGFFTAQTVFGAPPVVKRVETELTYDPARLPELARPYAVTAPEG